MNTDTVVAVAIALLIVFVVMNATIFQIGGRIFIWF